MRPPVSGSNLLKKAVQALLWLLFLWIGVSVVHAFESARTMAHKSTCLNNVKQILAGTQQYAQDWDECLPSAQQWASLSNVHVGSGAQIGRTSEAVVWHCPDAVSPYSYAFNSALSGLSYKVLTEPAQTLTIFEANATIWNAAGGKAQVVQESRHPVGPIYGFADGHVKSIRATPEQPYWQPLLLPDKQKH